MRFFYKDLNEFGFDCEIMTNYGKMLRKNNRVDESIKILSELVNYQEENNINYSYVAAKRELFKVYFINEFLEEGHFISTDKYLEIRDRYEKVLDGLVEVLKTKESE